MAGSGAAGSEVFDSHPSADGSLTGRIVMIAGATSESGRTVASALLDAGATVVAVGSNRERLDAFEAAIGSDATSNRLHTEVCDLTDGESVLELAMRVHPTLGNVDGIAHLVGGWRGGGGIVEQSDDDWDFLERSLTALRNVTRVFWDDLVGSDAGRLAIVSSTSVAKPTAGGANYVTIKAASETWMQAMAHGFRKAAVARDAAEPDAATADAGARRPSSDTGGAAAVTFRVKSLAGLETTLAASVVDLWSQPTDSLNGSVVTLSA